MPVVPECFFGCQSLELAQWPHNIVLSPTAVLAKERAAIRHRSPAERHGSLREVLHIVESFAALEFQKAVQVCGRGINHIQR